jgi:hypothetical protein
MENEEVVEELDVIDTSENNVEETEQQDTKTYSEDEVLARIEEVKAQMKEDNQKAWNKRWGQEKAKMEREFAKKNEAVNLFMQQTNTTNVDDLLNYSYEQYGVERPSVKPNSRDEEILGKYDAKEILELNDEMIEEEANRLAGIKRTAREEATFVELGNYLTTKKAEAQRKKEIKENGFDEEIVNSDDFKEFSKKFAEKTSLKDIYDIYSKTTGKVKEKPFSAGSANGKAVKEDTEYFTVDEFNALTEKDLEDERTYRKAMKTMEYFSKS